MWHKGKMSLRKICKECKKNPLLKGKCPLQGETEKCLIVYQALKNTSKKK